MFMANLSSADPVTNEAEPSYDSDILSEVQDHDHYQDVVCAHHEEHAMHDNLQLNHNVDSHADHTSDSNMIPYDHCVKDNVVPIVHSNVSSIPNDAFMMIYNDMKKMNEKMKDPKCVTRKVKIAPHDYSKENFLATFTPRKKLTPEQIFWSQDLIKLKSEALKEQTTVSKPIKALTMNNKDVHLDYLMHLKESVETIRDIVEEAKVKTNVPVSPPIRVNSCPNASRSQPRSNTKKNRISPAKGVNKLSVEDQPRKNKSHLRISNRVDSSSHLKRRTDRPLVFGLRLPKHMTGDRSWLMNFVKTFIGIVRFENDHFGAIMGYGDYVIGDNVISRVYYVEGLGHNLFSVRQFYDFDLEVAFRKHSCYVRYTDGVELIKGSGGSNLYTISIEDMMKSFPICLLSKASKNK
uniref:Integrase, catalytic region, zinc finger, CCHC-type, peptidase aspartic, catalytic n=1 Tax=Tanacetum cinerariifolium TaxID=118510 RepID=A0A6L2N450_TANCI|nr:integrase, catalytic region, zinc finger, CCHC-type, peptidase aspartic, catalytic [Tanacetum cinerariifolium]